MVGTGALPDSDSTRGPHSAASALGDVPRTARTIIYALLAWAFLHPAIHYYLGQSDVIGGAFGVSPAGLIDAAMFLFCAGVLALCVARGRIAAPLLLVPILLYVAATFYAVLISPLPTLSIRSAVVRTVPYLMFLDLVLLAGRANLSQSYARVAILSSFIPIAVGLLQLLAPLSPPLKELLSQLPADYYALQPYPELGLPRATGTFPIYNSYATFLAPLFWAVFLGLDARPSRLVRSVYLACVSVLILASFTRAVWLAMATSALLVVVLSRKRLRLAMVAAAVLLVVAIVVSPAGGVLATRFSSTTSLEERGGLVQFGVARFIEQPWGYGVGLEQTLTIQLAESETYSLRGDLIGGWTFHNEYVSAAVEGGIFLLAATLVLLSALVLLAYRVYRMSRWCPDSRKWGVWLAAATLILIQTGLTDSGLSYAAFSFWVLTAGVELEYRALRKARRARVASAAGTARGFALQSTADSDA